MTWTSNKRTGEIRNQQGRLIANVALGQRQHTELLGRAIEMRKLLSKCLKYGKLPGDISKKVEVILNYKAHSESDDTGIIEQDIQLRLLSTKEAAALLGVKPQWLETTRKKGNGPVFHKLSGLTRYTYSDIMDWVRENSKVKTHD